MCESAESHRRAIFGIPIGIFHRYYQSSKARSSLSRIPLTTNEEFKAVVSAANKAFPKWKNTPVTLRQRIMFKLQGLIRRDVMFPMAVTCGDTFILKPSEKDPGASVMLAELAMEAGLPDGVLNIVHGTHDTINNICDDEDIKAISFVGSNPAGMYIYARAAAGAVCFAVKDVKVRNS